MATRHRASRTGSARTAQECSRGTVIDKDGVSNGAVSNLRSGRHDSHCSNPTCDGRWGQGGLAPRRRRRFHEEPWSTTGVRFVEPALRTHRSLWGGGGGGGGEIPVRVVRGHTTRCPRLDTRSFRDRDETASGGQRAKNNTGPSALPTRGSPWTPVSIIRRPTNIQRTHPVRRSTDRVLLIELHRPVRLAEELRPALIRTSCRALERVPLRPDRPLPAAACGPRPASGPPSSRCSRCRPARSSPRAQASPRTGKDVVDRQLLAPRLEPAILAGVAVPLEEVPPAEGDDVRREHGHTPSAHHLGDPQPSRDRLEERLLVARDHRRPVRPAVEPVVQRIDDPGPLAGDQRQRPATEATPTGCHTQFRTSVSRVRAASMGSSVCRGEASSRFLPVVVRIPMGIIEYVGTSLGGVWLRRGEGASRACAFVLANRPPALLPGPPKRNGRGAEWPPATDQSEERDDAASAAACVSVFISTRCQCVQHDGGVVTWRTRPPSHRPTDCAQDRPAPALRLRLAGEKGAVLGLRQTVGTVAGRHRTTSPPEQVEGEVDRVRLSAPAAHRLSRNQDESLIDDQSRFRGRRTIPPVERKASVLPPVAVLGPDPAAATAGAARSRRPA